MEAKITKREIIDIAFFDLSGYSPIQLDYHYKSPSGFLSNTPSALFIAYDGELSAGLIKSVVGSYSGDYQVFHSFKTDKLYLSNITQYMKELFNIENKKEGTNE